MIQGMLKSISLRNRWHLLALVVFLLGLSLLALGTNSLVSGARTQRGPRDLVREEVRRQVSRRVSPNFQMSLEMRENVDFLLTPAILVQEGISDGVVITYPQE